MITYKYEDKNKQINLQEVSSFMGSKKRGCSPMSKMQNSLLGKEISYNNLASKAHNVVKRMILSGKLKSLKDNNIKCSDCNKRAEVYDHRSYLEPEIVSPLCKSCNTIRGSGKIRKPIINCLACESTNTATTRKGERWCRVCGFAWFKKQEAHNVKLSPTQT